MEKLRVKTGNIALYIILLIIILALMVGLKECSSVNVTNDTKAQGDTINVAIELSPIGLSTQQDTLSGFHYDLIRRICKLHNKNFKISPFTNLASALSQLDNGRFDIVIADIPVTYNMKENYLYTDSIYVDHQVLVRRKETIENGFNQNDLAGDTIWIPSGSLARERINNLSEEIGDTIYVIEDEKYGAEQLVILTALGEIKQSVVNKKYAEALAEKYPQLDISTDISFHQFQSWILQKDNRELCDSINNWLSKYKETDDYVKLYNRYFNGI